MEFASVTGITVICYLLGMLIKASPLHSKWIPGTVGVFGGILGVVGFYLMPDFPAQEPLTAIAVGISSGLASTGIHEAVKGEK